MTSQLLWLMLRPSLTSTLLTLLLGVGIIIGANWSYFTATPALFALFYGDSGFITSLERSPLLAHELEYGITQNPATYALVTILIAATTGWLAVAFIRSLKNDITALRALSDRYHRADIIRHVVLRIGIVSAWLFYGWLCVGFIIPYCLLLSRIGAETVGVGGGISLNIVALALLWLALHVHVVLLRAALFRPRVFGAHPAIEMSVFYADHHIQER